MKKERKRKKNRFISIVTQGTLRMVRGRENSFIIATVLTDYLKNGNACQEFFRKYIIKCSSCLKANI